MSSPRRSTRPAPSRTRRSPRSSGRRSSGSRRPPSISPRAGRTPGRAISSAIIGSSGPTLAGASGEDPRAVWRRFPRPSPSTAPPPARGLPVPELEREQIEKALPVVTLAAQMLLDQPSHERRAKQASGRQPRRRERLEQEVPELPAEPAGEGDPE